MKNEFLRGEIRPIHQQGETFGKGGVVIYSPGSNNRAVITAITFNNVDSDFTVSVYRNTKLINKKVLIYRLSLDAGDIIDDSIGYHLNDGDEIYIVPNSGAVSYTIEGLEYQKDCITPPSVSRGVLRILDRNGNFKGIGKEGPQGPAGPPGAAGLFVEAGTTFDTLTQLSFANGNGVTFGLNGSTLTASINALTSQSNQAASASNGSSTFQTLSFGNNNGLSFYYSNGSIVGSYTVPSVAGLLSNIKVSAGTQSENLSALTFENSNGISFGLSDSKITAAYTVPSFSHSSWTVSDPASSETVARLAFTNINGVTLSLSTGTGGLHTIVGSHNGITQQSNQTLGLYALGNTTQNNSSTFDARSLSFNAIGSITLGFSNGSIQVSAPNALTSQSNQAFSAEGGSSTFQTLVFLNANGLSFSNNGGSVQASYTVPSVTNSSWTVSDANTSATVGRLAFTNANGLTLSLSTSNNGNHTVVGSYTVPTVTNSSWTVSDGNTSGTVGRLAFSNANGFSFSLSTSNNGNHTIFGSYTVPSVTNSSMSISDANTSETVARLAFTNLNGVTLSISTGAGGSHTIVGSHNGLTSQSNQAFSASGGSSSFQTLVFLNGNGFTFSNNDGSVQGSYTVPTVTNSSWTVSDANTSVTVGRLAFTNANGLTLTLSTSNNGNHTVFGSHNGITSQTNQNISLYALGNTTQNSSTVLNASALSLSGSGNVTVGYSNGSIIIGQTGGGGQSNQTIGFYAVGNTTQNSSTTLDARTVSYNGLGAMSVGYSNGSIQLSAPATSSISGTGQVSISVNGSTISIGVPNASTLSGYNPYVDQPMVVGQVGQGTLRFEPEIFPNFQCDRILFPIHNTNSSNSSGSHTLSFWVGIYTRNNSSLSLYSSVSASTALTHSGTAGSYSLYSGIRHFTIGMTNTFTEGEYWIGFLSRTTSGGTNGSYSNMLGSNVNSAFQGFFGSSNNTTQQFTLGQGVYTATTSGMPGSVAFSQIRGSDSMALRSPIMLFASSTV